MSDKFRGYVYFVHAPYVNRIKIGYSSGHPDGRLPGLRNGPPVPLERLAFVRGDTRTEAMWHRRFRFARAVGEWFHATAELLDAVRREAEPWPPRDPRLTGAKARVPRPRGKKPGVWRRSSTGGAWYTTIKGRQVLLANPDASAEDAREAPRAYVSRTRRVHDLKSFHGALSCRS